jgi:hypothetical protein
MSIFRSVVILVVVAIATLLARILVPTIVITAYASFADTPAAVGAFAASVAQPLALAGAACVAFTAAWLRPAQWPGSAHGWSLSAGAAGAIALVTGGLWLANLDLWTAIGVVVLPTVALLATRRTPPERSPG